MAMRNVNKVIKATFILALIIGIVFNLTACCFMNNSSSDEYSEGLAVSFVCRSGNNFSFYGALSDPSIKEEVFKVAYNYADFSIFGVDGDPFLVMNETIQRPKVKVDREKRTQIAEEVEYKILSILASDQVNARKPEADTLKAITISANTLQDSSYPNKRMLILDSGLSTSGLLNFSAENIIERDPAELVDFLKTRNSIPNLSGVDVIWIGLGQVNDSQCTLSSDYIYKLETIWRAILKEGGADVQIHTGALKDYPTEQKLPSVSTVPVIVEPAIGVPVNTTGETKQDFGISEDAIIRYSEDTHVNFHPDTADFIDENAAREELEPVAYFLSNNPEAKFYIAGMTATWGDAQYCKQLSLKRAEAVKTLLLQSEYTIQESQLVVLGLGYEPNNLRTTDIIEDQFCEEYAKKNRAVYVIGEKASILSDLLKITECY